MSLYNLTCRKELKVSTPQEAWYQKMIIQLKKLAITFPTVCGEIEALLRDIEALKNMPSVPGVVDSERQKQKRYVELKLIGIAGKCRKVMLLY